MKASGGWLVRGVPVVSAQTAAAFRIVFMTLLLIYLHRHPVRLPDGLSDESSYAAAVAHWLTATPAVASRLDLILAATAVAVIIGAATRLTYALFVVTFLGWACLESANSSHHPISTLGLLLIGLLPARWSDAWSVDAWIRRRAGRVPGPPSPAYGYAVWLPGFVMGVAFAAAAWSKVGNGAEWIVNGTIRYHFVTDLRDALVTWGPRLTSIPEMAVAGSLAAVSVEAGLIGVAFLKGWRVRAALGAAAMLLLTGFALFQGVIWPGWWLLLLGFLPWQSLRLGQRLHAADARGTLAQSIAIVLIAAQQIIVTTRHVEIKPLFSTYDMYSTTYASPAEYEAKSNMVYRAVGITAAGIHVPLDGCVMSDNEAVALVDAWRQGPRERARLAPLRSCLAADPAIAQVVLEGDKRVFDWQRGEFYWKRGLSTLGPLELTGIE